MIEKFRSQIRCDTSSRCGCKCDRSYPIYTSFKWISHQLQSIYFETPKCISTSIRRKVFGIEVGQSRQPSGPYGFEILFDEDIDKYNHYFKFGISRNPWDRMVSNWAMYTQVQMRRGEIQSLWRIANASNIDFETFITKSMKIRNHHWEHQYVYLPVDEIQIDFIGRFENIQNDWPKICKQLKIKPVNLIKTNTTTHKPYQLHYNPTTRKIIAEEYGRDIELFGYQFEDIL